MICLSCHEPNYLMLGSMMREGFISGYLIKCKVTQLVLKTVEKGVVLGSYKDVQRRVLY